jgi:hypothetical protein
MECSGGDRVLLEVILTVILLGVCAALVWPRRGNPGCAARDDRFPSGVRPYQGPWPESREGTLARQLEIGEIDRSQYLRAMSQLAERDTRRFA